MCSLTGEMENMLVRVARIEICSHKITWYHSSGDRTTQQGQNNDRNDMMYITGNIKAFR